MTETTNGRRCSVGSVGDNPCPREATERFRPIDDGPNMCAAHAHAFKVGEEEDGWRFALDKLEEWAKDSLREDPFGELARLVMNARDEAREQYADACARGRAADLTADYHDGRITPEQGEHLALLMARCDGFSDARTMVEDAPEDALGERDRWVIVDTLAKAAEEASAEYEDYRGEIGLPEAAAGARADETGERVGDVR